MADPRLDAIAGTARAYVAQRLHDRLDPPLLDDDRRASMRAAIARCYAATGSPMPDTIMWAPNPIVGRVAAVVLAEEWRRRRDLAVASVQPWPALLGATALRWLIRAVRRSRDGAAFVSLCAVAGLIAGLIVSAPLWLLWVLAAEEDYGALVNMTVLGASGCAVIGALAGLRESVGILRAEVTEQRRAEAADAAAELTGMSSRIAGAILDAEKSRLRQQDAQLARELVGEPIRAAVRHLNSLARSAHDDTAGTTAMSLVQETLAAAGATARHFRRHPPPSLDAIPGVASAQETGRIASLLWLIQHGRARLGAERRAVLHAFAEAAQYDRWPHPDFVVVSDNPVELHVEPGPDGAYRLHRADGPAARWLDGTELHAWHGLRVPAELISPGWHVRIIHEETNSEIRRAAIEHMGWMTYIERAGLTVVATAPDPGNPPHELVLYEDYFRRLGNVRVLVMTNGSPDRDGKPLRYAELAPAFFSDPVEAAAWQYDCPVEVYRQLGRRTCAPTGSRLLPLVHRPVAVSRTFLPRQVGQLHQPPELRLFGGAVDQPRRRVRGREQAAPVLGPADFGTGPTQILGHPAAGRPGRAAQRPQFTGEQLVRGHGAPSPIVESQ